MKAYINKLKQWCKKIFQGYFFIGFIVSSSVYMPFYLYNDYNHKVEINNMKNDVEVILERGSLYINIVNDEAIMTGPAEISFYGSLDY